MKKWMIILALLLLTGCQNQNVQAQPPEAGDASQESQSSKNTGLYLPDSALEQQTDGAVRLFSLESDDYTGLIPLGENLLLFQKGEVTKLTLLEGMNLVPVVQKELSCFVEISAGEVQVGTQGIAYLDKQAKTLAFLNTSLREVSRLQLPEDFMGQAWLSPDWSEVYFCTDQGIQVLNMNTGVIRLLREQHEAEQSVTGVLMEGFVLRCEFVTEDGKREAWLIDAQTGELLWEGSALSELVTFGQNWYLPMESGAVLEHLVGSGEQVMNLWPNGLPRQVFALLENQTAVACVKENDQCHLDCYSTKTGNRTASVLLSGIREILAAHLDQTGRGLWILGKDGKNGNNCICYWQPEKSPVEDKGEYLQPHYTRQNPDDYGMERLGMLLDNVEDTYGVQFLLGEALVEKLPDNYRVETEYLVPTYEAFFPKVKNALAQFPEGFFSTLAKKTRSGVLHIALVRYISGVQNEGTVDRPVIQYWQDGEAYLVLSLGENIEQNFYHGLMHMIETRVLSVCNAFYEWDKRNPEDFSYDNDYIKNQNRDGSQYLKSGENWFADTFSMSYAREDRAGIFAYACMPGQEGLFRSFAMQQKLRAVCQGIRQAFGMEEMKETFLWEQYLSDNQLQQ